MISLRIKLILPPHYEMHLRRTSFLHPGDLSRKLLRCWGHYFTLPRQRWKIIRPPGPCLWNGYHVSVIGVHLAR